MQPKILLDSLRARKYMGKNETYAKYTEAGLDKTGFVC